MSKHELWLNKKQNSKCDNILFRLKLLHILNTGKAQSTTKMKLWQTFELLELKMWKNSKCEKSNADKTQIVMKIQCDKS